MAFPALAQIPAPQIPLTGNVGTQGFPLLNSGTLIFASDANHTMTAQESSATGGIKITSGVTLTATRNLVLPTAYGKLQFVSIENATTGGQSIIVIGQSGTGITIPNGQSATGVWYDGTNVTGTLPGGGSGTVTTVSVATANGFQGTVANPTTTPAITVNVDGTHVLPVNTGSSSNCLTQAGTYVACSSGGAVSSVSNSDGTLTVTPTTGAVVASLALGHANTWTATQTFAGSGPPISIPIPAATGSTAAFTNFGTDSSGNVLLKKNGGTTATVCDSINGLCSSVFPFPEVPVENFGAVGYSTQAAAVSGTDSTTAINNCETSLATTGGLCILKNAFYKITAPIVISSSNVGITGANATVFPTGSSPFPVVPGAALLSTSATADILQVGGTSSVATFGNIV